MSFSLPPFRAWLLVVLAAVGFTAWTSVQRAQRAEQVSNTDREEAVLDASSPTGYAGGRRWLIAPEHNNRSYQWIAETQRMLARHEWRVRRTDDENAPFGREVHSPSPYRWWLGLVAWCDHSLSGRTPGLAVERAALWADPLLQLLFLLGTTLFVARQFGALPAALTALGIATLYPFAGGFLAGGPDDGGLIRILAVWSVLPLLAGARLARQPRVNPADGAAASEEMDQRRRQRLFALGGIVGGLGLWIGASDQALVLAGLFLGGLLSSWLVARATRGQPPGTVARLPWRIWALAGASTCLVSYLIEYFPHLLDFRLEVNHPLYGLAWIGLGDLLAEFEAVVRPEKPRHPVRRVTRLLLGLAAIAALPVAAKMTGAALFAPDLSATRLTFLPNGAVAKNVAAWIVRDGLTGSLLATCAPLVALLMAATLLLRRRITVAERAGLALALGPAIVATLLAFSQLAWWSMTDGLLLAVLVAASAAVKSTTGRPFSHGRWGIPAAIIFLPGALALLPAGKVGGTFEFTRLDVESLVERGLAHWMADHARPGAVILVPPFRTTGLCFHSGLRGLGTANWENRSGLEASIRIVTATTAAAAKALLDERGVNYIVLPSWDSDLDEFARWTLRNPDDAFIMALHHWTLPPWLRPMPYPLPDIPGFEGQSVALFEVTDETNRVAALARLADYFIETKQTALLQGTNEALQRFPADLTALAALAQLQRSLGDSNGFAKTFEVVVSSVAGGFDRNLAWDRRLGLAVVLAEGNRNDLARAQLQRCLATIDDSRLRSLTTDSLFRLEVLAKAFGLEIADPRQRQLALRLLPEELRHRL